MNKRLLIIEDNAQNLYMMRFLLEKRGFTVVGAETGPRGIELALTCDPVAILLDIQLPGMDGYAVARELRKNPALRGVPIVAVTSYAMAGDREKTLAAGCTAYMEKPIDPETFGEEIDRQLAAEGPA